MPNIKILTRTRRGDALSANLINEIKQSINNNTRAIAAPKQIDSSVELDDSAGLTDLDFTETSRSETTVQVTDSNGDTHDIEQGDQYVLQNSSGDVLTLNFTN